LALASLKESAYLHKQDSSLEVGTMALARVTTKGQVTIPAEIRKALDIGEGDD
jgi:hypothetical protein